MQLPLLLGLIAALIVLVTWAGFAWGWPFIVVGLGALMAMKRRRSVYRAR